jgi:hypothetical protein
MQIFICKDNKSKICASGFILGSKEHTDYLLKKWINERRDEYDLWYANASRDGKALPVDILSQKWRDISNLPTRFTELWAGPIATAIGADQVFRTAEDEVWILKDGVVFRVTSMSMFGPEMAARTHDSWNVLFLCPKSNISIGFDSLTEGLYGNTKERFGPNGNLLLSQLILDIEGIVSILHGEVFNGKTFKDYSHVSTVPEGLRTIIFRLFGCRAAPIYSENPK